MLFSWENGGGGMYPVSDAFLRAVRSNTRKYFWTGTIVTKGGMTYEFGAKEGDCGALSGGDLAFRETYFVAVLSH